MVGGERNRKYMLLVYSFVVARYLRWNGLMTIPPLRSALNVWLSIIHSESSESCALMNSAKFAKFS